MPEYESRPYGSTGISVAPLCVGTSSWQRRDAESDSDHSGRIRELALAVADAAISPQCPLNFVDTSNIYADGMSERLIGGILTQGIWDVDTMVIQTKLDRDVATGDFSGDRMWASLEESLERMGVSSVPVLFIHDPENTTFEYAMAAGGPVEVLVEMKEQGLAANIGVSGGSAALMQKFVETDVFDTLINHNRWTLLDRSADELFSAATSRKMGITNAAPFGAGILTGDARFANTYGYAPIRPETRAAAVAMESLCREAGIPIAAAALQFSLREPRVHSTVVGISSAARLETTLELARIEIEDDLWAALEKVRPPRSAWIG
jgi:D-threo-aldose 1-dehydrogenase